MRSLRTQLEKLRTAPLRRHPLRRRAIARDTDVQVVAEGVGDFDSLAGVFGRHHEVVGGFTVGRLRAEFLDAVGYAWELVAAVDAVLEVA